MSLKSNVILIASLLAVPIIGSAYYAYIISNYDYTLQNIEVQSVDRQNANLLITIGVASKIGISFTITDMYFDIYIDGFNVGNVMQQTPLLIPNFGNGQVQLLASVDISKVVGDIGNIIVDITKKNASNVSLVGYSHVQVGVLPFTTNVALKFGYSLAI